VPTATLERIFSVSQRAPSNCNTQPWITHVASGASLQTLREELPRCFMKGEMSLDFPYDGVYQGVYKERQYGSAQALYDAAGIAREDKVRRQEQFMRNFTFFDAPHVAFLFLPEPFGLREACDLGMYAQTLMLSMTAHGLGSCPQTALSFEADIIREILEVDSGNKLLFGISFGFPDADAPVNRCATDRAGLADCVYFHS
jgi:nitroreductase